MVECSLFRYRNQQEVSIHSSWLNNLLLWIIRIASLGLILVRFALYYNDSKTCCAYSLIYLTFYGYVLSMIYFIVVVVHLLLQKLSKQNSVVRYAGYCINILFESVFAIQFMLTILFWTILSQDGEDLGSFDNLGMHLIPFLLLLADFIFNSYVFPLRHWIITFILGAIYLIINKVHSCTVSPVYGAFQCDNIWLVFAAFAMLAVAHLIGHAVWRCWRRGKLVQQQKQQQMSQEQSLMA